MTASTSWCATPRAAHLVVRDAAGRAPDVAANGATRALAAVPSAYATDVANRAAVDAPGPDVPAAAGPTRAFSPWRTLVPRWWSPVVGAADGGTTTLGASSSAADPIGRHAWVAALARNVTTGDVEGSAAWRRAGLGHATLDASVGQGWSYDTVLVRPADGGTGSVVPVGVDRRARTAAVLLTVPRPRWRTNAALSAGATMEWRDHRSDVPAAARFVAGRLGTRITTALVTGSWANTRRPLRAVSPEDGVALGGTVQQRWADGAVGRSSTRALGVARAYKAFDLPGYAQHVLAVRLAGAAADRRAATEWSAGGVSGTSAELLPGVAVGDVARPLGARGFPAGAQRGLRGLAGSLEWRAPLALPARGWRLVPLFLDRVAVVGFADAATAWCPAGIDRARQPLCSRDARRTPTGPRPMASVGGELVVDAAPGYDQPLRFRGGLAVPVARTDLAPSRVSVYATLGLSF